MAILCVGAMWARPTVVMIMMTCNNVALQVAIVCRPYYHLHPQQIFTLQKVDGFYFLQRENLLREEVVIRATNNRNLQRNVVARQVERKMLPGLVGL